MQDEKPRYLSYRLEHPLKARVENFESRTGISALSLQKALLEAAMDFFDKHHYIVLPVEIVVSKGPMTATAAVLAEEPVKESAIKYADKKAKERSARNKR